MAGGIAGSSWPPRALGAGHQGEVGRALESVRQAVMAAFDENNGGALWCSSDWPEALTSCRLTRLDVPTSPQTRLAAG